MCDLYTQLDKLRLNVMYTYPTTMAEIHKNSLFARHVIKAMSNNKLTNSYSARKSLVGQRTSQQCTQHKDILAHGLRVAVGSHSCPSSMSAYTHQPS